MVQFSAVRAHVPKLASSSSASIREGFQEV